MDQPNPNSLTWSFPEYPQHERSRRWFIVACVIAGGMFIFSLFAANFLFAGIIVFTALIIALQHYRPPLMVTFQITQDGIATDNHSIPWKDIKSFWLVYEPPAIKNLYFEFKGVRPRLRVPLLDQNPLNMREALIPYLNEDLEKEDEPLSDALGRVFKL